MPHRYVSAAASLRHDNCGWLALVRESFECQKVPRHHKEHTMYGSVVTYLGTPEPLFRLGRKSRKAQVTTAPIAIATPAL